MKEGILGMRECLGKDVAVGDRMSHLRMSQPPVARGYKNAIEESGNQMMKGFKFRSELRHLHLIQVATVSHEAS